MKDGFILIHRKLLDWEWYQNTNDTRLFIHFLLKANWKDGTYKGNEIPRGSFVTTFNKLAEETGLSIQQIRTSIKHLKLTQEITQEQHGYFSVITIRKYNDYQLDNTQINTQATDEQQTYRIKEKKEKKSKKESISKDIPKKEIKYFESLKVNTIFNEFLEVRKKLKAVNSERAIKSLINELNEYDEETQYKMIEQSIVNSWKGIFELKTKKDKSYTFSDLLKESMYE